ncbi:MAG: hypothetical protein NTY04_00465 [Candidatus Staskawiczbacteria bacterium]|nr:hypothetical protein [Candidatus Staskawiczbacteria bacterium]
MITYTDWSLTVIQPFLQQLISFIANFVLALVVFVIGYLISIGIGKIIAEILKSIKFNKLFEKEGWRKALQRANVEVNPAEFIGVIFKWVFAIMFLLVAVDVLKLTAFAGFLTQVLDYLPNVIVAVLVFVVAIIISDIVEKVVRVTVERLKVGYGYIASSIVNWAIWIFTFFLILDLVLPRSLLIKTLYTSIVYGIVGALALGVGLAIGLGGKETAGKIISDMYRKIDEK